jgi:hypothetical protein
MATAAHQREAQLAGLALVGAGAVTKIFSGAANPEADIRAWENLPAYLSFVAFELPPGRHALTVEFLDGRDQPLAGLTRSLEITVPEQAGDTVIYLSDQSIIPKKS